jgi:hypothetical protein
MDSRDVAYLDQAFKAHKPKPGTAELHVEVRLRAGELAAWVLEHLPSCPERSTALNRIEEAMFWTNAGIARENAED